jgi:hypothetical protein
MERVINRQGRLLQRGKKLILPFLFVTALMLGANNTWADGPVTLLHVIPIPGFSDLSDPAHPHAASFDIGWTDRGKFYFSDRGPTATAYGDCGGRVDIIDAQNDTLTGFICGFVGNRGPSSISGPDGILVLHRHGRTELWVGDGDSTVKVVDPDAQVIVDTISTGGTKRADELAYDSKHHIIMVTNPDDDPPFLTFISQETHEVLGKLFFDGISAPKATDGLEQPVFDKSTKKFYQNVPETPENEGGEIDVIDPVRMVVTDRFPASDSNVGKCNAHGLDLGPDHHLILGCANRGVNTSSIVMDDRDGSLVATITQVGGSDQVWFNKGDDRYYLAASNCNVKVCGGPVLGVIDAETNQWIENVPTATGAHVVAVNPRNNHIFVPRGPVSGPGSDTPGVAVYGHGDDD